MITPGIHPLPAAQYHADPCPVPSLSNSIANVLLTQSPLHAWYQHPRLNPTYQPEESSRFDLGSAAHMMLLERRTDRIVIVNADDWRTKAAKEARDNARANGQTPVLPHQFDAMRAMNSSAQAFMETTELAGILEIGSPEQTVIWQENDIWCRCRPDLLSADKRVCFDYKTSESAQPEFVSRQIQRMGYDIQSQFYTRGLASVGFDVTFVFLFQEIHEPYCCSLISLSNAYMEVGKSKVERAIRLWTQCTETNRWPAYSNQILYCEPRPWDLAELDETPTTTEDEE